MSCIDAEGDSVEISVLEQPEHGSLSNLSVSPAGSQRFAGATYVSTPSSYRGQDEFTVRASDGSANRDVQILIDVVDPTDDPPQCFATVGPFVGGNPGRANVEAGEAEQGGISCLDEQPSSLSYTVSDSPDHGTLSSLTNPGAGISGRTFTYTSTPITYRGDDEFTLRVSDGVNPPVDVVVQVNVVDPTDNAPVCGANVGTIDNTDPGRNDVEAGETTSGTFGCTDDEGEALEFSVADPPDHGTLGPLQPFAGAGPNFRSFTYTSSPSTYRGNDEFTLRVTDGTTPVDVVVRVDVVAPSNDAPQCLAFFGNGGPPPPGGRYDVEAGEPLSGSVGCQDEEGDDLTFSVFDPPDQGSLSALTDPGGPPGGFPSKNVTYTAPAGAYRGNDEFTIRVQDEANTLDVVVRLNVIDPRNDPPQCFVSLSGTPPPPGGRYSVEAGQAAQGTIACMDEENDPLTFSVFDQPDNGTLSALSGTQNSRSFSYTSSPATYRGDDEFTLRVSDGSAAPVDLTVRLTVVDPVDQQPTCTVNLGGFDQGDPGRNTVPAGQSQQGSIDCQDADGDALTFAVQGGPDHGTLGAFTGTGSSRGFTYTSSPATYRGNDEFTIRVSDGSGDPVDVVKRLRVVDPPAPPDPDDDGDGVSDAADACPTVAAATANGCPAPSTGGGAGGGGSATTPPAAPGGSGGGGPVAGSGGRGGQPSCQSLAGKARAKCQLAAQITAKCGKATGAKRTACAKRLTDLAKCGTLKGKKKSVCTKRVNALAKCGKLKGKKKASCVRKAKQIGKAKKKKRKA